MSELAIEIAATAARLVVEEGLSFGQAKHRAIKALGLPGRTALPGNDEVEAQVREYIALFCADTQPDELLALREHALLWMRRLQTFRPHLTGAVWLGWATRLTDIDLALFCDDAKSAEIELINQNQRYEVQSVRGMHGKDIDVLSLHSFCPGLREDIGVHLRVYDLDDLRGALQPDAQGRAPRGDIQALERLLTAA
jgi:hypothetical protein